MLQSTALKSYLGGLTGADLDGDGFQLALDRLPTCIGYVSSDRRYLYANAKYRELLGLSLQEIVGRSIEEVIGSENYKPIDSDISQVLEGLETEFEATIAYQGGGSQRAHFKCVPHAGENDEVVGFLVIVTDVSGAYGVVQTLQERESRAKIDTSERPILVSYCDAYGRILFVNRAYADWYGVASEKIVGRHWVDILGMANVSGTEGRVSQAFQKQRVEFQDVLTLQDRKKRHMRGVYLPHIEGESVVGMFALRVDLTTLHETIEALRSHDGNLVLQEDDLPEAVSYVDAEERYRFTNRAHREMFGYKERDVTGKKVSEVVPPELYQLAKPNIQRALSGETLEFEDAVSLPGERERVSWATFLPHFDGSKVKGYILVRSDITALRMAEAEFRHIAAHDPLTGLVNLRQFRDRFNYLSQLAGSSSIGLCVLIMKVEGLKAVNDKGGRRAGDFVLNSIAKQLQKVCGKGKTAARVGSDEFAVIMAIGDGIKDGMALAEKIAKAAREPITYGKNTLSVHASIGVALVDRFVTDGDGALRMASDAMQAARRLSKDCAVFGYHRAASRAGEKSRDGGAEKKPMAATG